MPSPRPSPILVLELSPESLGKDEGEEVGTDDEDEEGRIDNDDEEVEIADVERVPGGVKAADARRILKWPLLNLGLVSPGLNIAMKKVEVSFMFCFSVNTLQAKELVFVTLEEPSTLALAC